ncbi:MAG: S9 family peptidase, partial [Pirellulales bacterium]|nr:S9 family peptidase [Pirellulales bacterium]
LKRIHLVTDEYWYASHWSNDSKQLLMWRRVSALESYPAVFDFSTNKLTMLPTATKDPAFYTNLLFSPDGREVYMTTDAFSEFHELVAFNRETGKYTRLTADIPWDVDETTIDRKSGSIAFTVNQEGTSRLFVREHGGTRRELPLPAQCIVSDARFSVDGKKLGFTLHSPTAPRDVFSVDLKSGELTRWTHSVTGGLNPNSFVEPTLVSYPSFDGRKISAFLYRPPQAGPKNPVPTIIMIHGGPASQYRPVFSSRIQYYVGQLGCAVICPNVRGSSGYGKTFLALDNGMKREDSVRDIGALLDWIVSQKDLDAKRVAVTGRSYGGYMVLASLVHYSDRLRAGIEAAGIANFASFLEHTESYRQNRRRVEYGDERTEEMRAFFDRIAPSRNAAKIQTPLLVVHGVNDPRVPFSEAQKIVNRLISLDRDVWGIYVGNEGHIFRKRSNTDYIRVVEVMFLQRHLALRNVQ